MQLQKRTSVTDIMKVITKYNRMVWQCKVANSGQWKTEYDIIKHNENSNLSYTGVLEYLGSKEQLRCFSLEICVYVFGNTEVVLSVQGQYIHIKTY